MFWSRFFAILLAFQFKLVCVEAKNTNILACLSSASRSHHIFQTTILEELANRGHNVTVLSTFPALKGNLPQNYHHIYIEIEDDDDWTNLRKEMLNETKNNENQLKRIPKTIQMITRRSSGILKHEIVQNLLKSNQKFDLFMLGYNINDPILGIAGHFRVPTIVLSTIPSLMKSLRDFIGNPAAISSAPLYAIPESVRRMGFRERWSIFVEYMFEYIFTEYTNYFIFEPFYNEHFGSIDGFPTLDDVKKNVSLILFNSHFSEGRIRPLLPNLIEVNGVHLKEKANPLPMNFQTIIDEANESGVIVFSFGGNIRSADMTAETVQMFYNDFSKLKQKIIWKWESTEIPKGKPDNVYMMQWLPQVDLLAQPQKRFFISHCGIGSVYEAKFHGVPILRIPIGGDQLSNSKQVKSQGWAVILDYDHLNETILTSSIHDILTNSSYKLTAQKRSQLFRDRPMNPLQTAVYWVEYVIRHDGAKHMQTPAVHLNFFQQNSFDIILLLVVVFYILYKITVIFLRLVIKHRSLLILVLSTIVYFAIRLNKQD